jgi:glycosyltransferase involved in cell wall biosynthesis
MQKIVIVTDAWEPQVNGVVRTLKETTKRLTDFDVTVINPSLYKGLNIKKLEGLALSLPPYRMGKILDSADIIHISTEGPLGFAARLHCEKKKYRYTTAYHTNFPAYLKTYWNIPERLSYAFFRWFHGNSESVMVPSQSMVRDLTGRGFKNVVHWGRGVDTDIFKPYESLSIPKGHSLADVEGAARPFWLNVGRVSKEKNLTAFLDLDMRGTKFIIGTGPEIDKLKKQYPAAKFLGEKKGIELAHLYSTADVFVFPSRFDTFGLVNAEAISCGVPVAAFPVTGPIDIIKQGKTGYYDEDLKFACMKALDIRQARDDFSWERATEQFIGYLVEKERPSGSL